MRHAICGPRSTAFFRQDGYCYYCDCQMWLANPVPFMAEYGITELQARRLQCTGEHLHPASEGGGTTLANIVAACWFCNVTRHRRAKPQSPSAYRARVRGRMAQGRWQQRWVFERGLSRISSSKPNAQRDSRKVPTESSSSLLV